MSRKRLHFSERIKRFFHREGVHNFAKSVIVVAMAYALARVLSSPLSFSLGAMSSMASSDFSITDMYQIVADSRDVRTYNQDIVIVDVNDCSRDQIRETLEMVNLCAPKAVGIDITFVDKRRDDGPLVEAIANTPNIACVRLLTNTGEEEDSGEPLFKGKQRSWFTDETSDRVHYCAANFPTQDPGGMMRNFKPFFHMEDGTKIPSFATALASLVDPEKAKVLEQRNHSVEPIYYPSTEFKILLPGDIYDHAEELIDKTVIIGVLNDPGDLHRTPMDAHMSGTLIQAYALNTILSGNYLTLSPGWVGELVAFLLTLFFVYICFAIKSGIRGVLLRVLQLLTLYLMLYAGYWFFIERNIIIDFSRSFLMLAFALFSVDIWNGCYYIWQKWIWPLFGHKAPEESSDNIDSGSGQDLGLDTMSAGIDGTTHM